MVFANGTNEGKHKEDREAETTTAVTDKGSEVASDGHARFWMFNDIRVFSALVFIITVVHASVLSFTSGILYTLEKRYGLTAEQLGILQSVNSITVMCTMPFVAHFFGKPTDHRPRWLGVGVIVLGIAYLVNVLPQFVFPPYEYDKVGNYSSGGPATGSGLCGTSPTIGGGDDGCDEAEQDASAESQKAYTFFAVGNALSGIGYGFLGSLCLSYIDDFAGRQAALLLGLSDAAWGLGLPLGFGVLGLACLSQYVDFNRVDMAEIDIDESDPRWVGAWWLVGLVGGPLIILLSVPLFFFPKRLPIDENDRVKGDEESESEQREKSNSSKGTSLLHSVKDFLLMTLDLIRNPVFVLLSFAYILTNPIAFSLFMPKYFQKDLGFTTSMSNLIVGIMWLFPHFPTAIILGLLLKKFKAGSVGLTKLIIGLTLTILITNILIIIIPCEGPYLRGTREGEKMVVGCNSGCDCDLGHYQPVCGSDGMDYYSPCYAGCSSYISDKNFTDCLCINPDDPANAFAQDGLCPIPLCKYFIAFLVILLVFSAANSGLSLPVTMVTIRCVEKGQKSFALAVKQVIASLFRIPGNILSGTLIDYTCVLWREDCGNKGACAQYDNRLYRVAMMSLSAAMSTVSLFMFFIVLYLVVRRHKRQGRVDGHGKQDSSTRDDIQLQKVEACSYDNQSFRPTE
ncbi:solute carrier organic anion transporter family member 3A1-like [Ptychodera flava]|uniref:solute carrier organic anion transporter family member 3A1-like n=1 Tax=Ptychodera flava TaxID=63121 RepID=UPI00396A8982